jgi:hypothetical protein
MRTYYESLALATSMVRIGHSVTSSQLSRVRYSEHGRGHGRFRGRLPLSHCPVGCCSVRRLVPFDRVRLQPFASIACEGVLVLVQHHSCC